MGQRDRMSVADRRRRPRGEVMMSGDVRPKDAMEFFRAREGQWVSWRVTHHLAFRRDETGLSEIEMECLEKDDGRIRDLCKVHEVDADKAQGGCYVTWKATMAWDQEGENHEGSTVFALVPDEQDPRKGKILRDRGYAEIVQIAGDYELDDDYQLNLVTPYEGGEVKEVFYFDGPDVVNRVSSVKRFGGFATATFATERRKGTEEVKSPSVGGTESFSIFGGALPQDIDQNEPTLASAFRSFSRRPPPSAADQFRGPPSARSAFSSGFTVPQAPAAKPESQVDLSKIPPSMREAYTRTMSADEKSPDSETKDTGRSNESV